MTLTLRHRALGLALLAILLVQSKPILAGDDGPLAPFAKFIGEWHMQGSVQVVEWGLGRLSVKASSYSVTGDTRHLVSEGSWFWHPALKEIKGYFTAVGMPVAFFDYTTRFDGDNMISALKAYTSAGAEQVYEEVWALGDVSYEWELWQQADGDKQKIMSGTFRKGDAD